MSPTLGFPPKPLAPGNDAQKKPVTASPVTSRVAAMSEKDMEIAALRQQVARLQAAEDLRSRASAPKPAQVSNIGGFMAPGVVFSSSALPQRGAQVCVPDHDVLSDGNNLNDVAYVVRNDVPTARSVGAPKFMDPVSGIGPSVVPLVANPPSSTPSGLPSVSPVGVVGGGYTSQPLPPGGASVYATSGHYVIPSAPSTMSVPGMPTHAPGRISSVTWPTFAGKLEEDARAFLFDFEIAASNSGIMFTDAPRLISALVGQCLKDAARTWFTCTVVGTSGFAAYLASTSWNAFRTVFEARWMTSLQMEHVRFQFDALRQTGSVSAFVDEFNKTSARLVGAYSTEQLIHLFISKLAPDVQQFVRAHAPYSLETAIRLALQFAAAATPTMPKSTHAISINSVDAQPSNQMTLSEEQAAQLFAFLSQAKPSPWPKGSSSSGPRRSGLPPRHLFKITQDEYERRLRDNACLTCGKPGHRSRQCQLRQKPSSGLNPPSA